MRCSSSLLPMGQPSHHLCKNIWNFFVFSFFYLSELLHSDSSLVSNPFHSAFLLSLNWNLASKSWKIQTEMDDKFFLTCTAGYAGSTTRGDESRVTGSLYRFYLYKFIERTAQFIERTTQFIERTTQFEERTTQVIEKATQFDIQIYLAASLRTKRQSSTSLPKVS